MNTPISAEQIAALLKYDATVGNDFLKKHYAIPEQHGPLRYFDPPWKPCASRGCRTSTPYRVQGISYCTVHALRKLNDMLMELGVEK